MRANTVASVFKALLISTMLMIVVGTAVNLWSVFNIQKKVDAIGTAMSTELSKNNAILYDSVDGFADQLLSINDVSGGMYQLRSVEINKGGSGDTDREIIHSEPVKATDGKDLASVYATTYTKQYNGNSEMDAYYAATQGKYGDFATLKVTYYVTFDIFSYPGGETSSMMPRRIRIGKPVTFEYKVPCLRYMK